MLTEHETFLLLTEHLSKASEAAQRIGLFRHDQSKEWSLIADMLTKIKDNVYSLAMQKVN